MVNHSELICDGVSVGTDRRVNPDTVDPEILSALEEFNKYYSAYEYAFWESLLRAQKIDDKNRSPIMLIRWPGDSKTDVAVTQPPFGTNVFTHPKNPNSLNTAVKNYLLDFTNRQRGLTDRYGNPLSTLVIAGPDRDYVPHFSIAEHISLAKGDFSPYASRVFDVMKSFGYEAGIYYGYSRASAVGGAVLRNAAKQNIDIYGAVLAEPTDFIKQNTFKFLKGYFGNYAPDGRPSEMGGHWWDDGPKVMQDQREDYGDGSYIGNFRHLSVLPTIRGMSQGQLRYDIEGALREDVPVVMAYGENSGVAHEVGEKIITDKELTSFAKNGLLRLVKVGGKGSGHDWGENHLAYTATFSDGLLDVCY